MKVLVTGGAGYIGSHTAKALVRAGHAPVVFDNLTMGHAWAARWGELVIGDLADGLLLRRIIETHGIEAVVHFAANACVGESVREPRKYFRNNVSNTINLLDAMLDSGVSLMVFSSTCATYGVPERVPIDEAHRQSPINPYGESKLMVERVLDWYGEAYSLNWMALRYFNAAGADPEGEVGEEHAPETHIIPLAIQAALGRLPHFEIFGTDYSTRDGTAVRDYIHVSDLADAHVRALDLLRSRAGRMALNLGTGTGVSVRDVVRAVENVSGKKVEIRETARRTGDPPVLIADWSRACELLGWRPQRSSLEEIVETAWRWHARGV